VARIRGRFGTDVPLVRVFQHPTVEALSSHLAKGAEATPSADPMAEARVRAERRRAGIPRRRLEED
jgi:hypothetical protein